MHVRLPLAVLIGVTVSTAQPAQQPPSGCDDLLGRWEYISPPSPLPGVVDIWREADGNFVGQWQRVPPRADESSFGTWAAPHCEASARWWILFGTRPAPSCKGLLLERTTSKTIAWFCQMPDGTESLAGAAQRPS